MKGIKEIKKGDYILHRDEPHWIVNKENVTVGTHSHTKLRVSVEGLFSGNKEVLTVLPHSVVEDVKILRKKGQLIASSPSLQVMDMVSFETFEATAEPDIRSQLQEGDEITFVEFKGTVKILEKRG